MAQYKIGSVNVTNGSATVTGVDTLWSSEISAGDIFTVVGDNAWYEVGSVGSNTSITLTSSYSGTTASGAQYAISRDFTTNKSIPYPQKGDIETASLLKRAMNIIDTELSTGFDSSNVTITGGTINGTSVGATTASSGAFTTLSSTGNTTLGDAAGDTVTVNGTATFANANPTLSAGTANGVAYLNGSKVLTSGSALTFDGSTLNVTGAYQGSGNIIISSGFIRSPDGSAATPSIQPGVDNDTGFFRPTTNQIGFSVGGTEAMRLTSTGLGIGTSSPGAKLDVVASAGTRQAQSAFTSLIVQRNATEDLSAGINIIGGGTTGQSRVDFSDSAANAMGALIYSHDSNYLRFDTNATERMRLDSSGNLGVGTSSPSRPLTIGTAVSAYMIANGQTTGASYQSVSSTGANVSWGSVDSAGGLYTSASAYAGFFGTFNATPLQLVTNGTARATIDSSGNLGIGTSSPGSLVAGGNNLVVGGGSGNTGMSIYSGTTGVGAIYFADGTTGADAYRGWFEYKHNTNSFSVGTNGSERLALDSSGNLLVGTTSSLFTTTKLQVTSATTQAAGFQQTGGASNTAVTTWNTGTTGPIYQHKFAYGVNGTLSGSITTDSSGNASYNSEGALVFGSNGTTERARIDSSGNLLVGATSAVANSSTPKFTVSSSTGNGAVIQCANGNTAILTVNQSGTASYYAMIFGQDGNLGAASVGNIQVNSTTTAYNTSSDYRLKNTIAPMTGALAKVAALKPCTYKWNLDGSYGEGFIAHELAEVVPQCVSGEKDAVDADGKPVYQGIDTSFLVATLTAALQELNAKVEAQAAQIAQQSFEIAALKSK